MKGLGTSVGIGIGNVLIYKEPELNIVRKHIIDSELENKRLEEAINKSIEVIEEIYKDALKKVGEKEAEIFIAHKMILEDPEFTGEIKERIIKDKVNSEWAVNEITNHYISLFEAIDNEYLRQRSIDLKDVSSRLLRILLNITSVDLSAINCKTIIVAKDLTPSDTAQLKYDMVTGIVTEIGGSTSHTSIIARAMNIPAICGVKNITNIVKEKDTLIINGHTGEIIINPSSEEIEVHESEKRKQEELNNKFNKMKGQKSISKDGHRVHLVGNIGTPEDVDKVLENDGEGIGLLRTEFLYMHRDKLPEEEEQFRAYKKAVEKLGEKPLIIRTLDVGGDKEIPYLNIPKELNPFLGCRGIRYSLEKEDIFYTQIRAILRASAYGNIKIMFPMISSIEEVRRCKSIIEEVKEQFKKENIKFNQDIKVGIMVEIPAVAINSRAFAKEVDFFSIGTNDLIQYTLAVDRGNVEISHLYNQFHPAVLSSIKTTIENGHKEGIMVGMCGEAASDEKLIPVFLAMGLDEFSMNPSSILKARYLINNTSKEEIEDLIDTIISLPTALDVKNFIDENIIFNI